MLVEDENPSKVARTDSTSSPAGPSVETVDESMATVAWLPPGSCGSRYIYEAMQAALASRRESVDGFDAPRCLLRHWHATARERNAYGLMTTIVGLSQKLGVSLDELDAPSLQGSELPLLQNGRLAPPVDEIMSSCSGFCLCRTDDDGQTQFRVNEAFAAQLATEEELAACWRENKRKVASLFLHPDDLQPLHTLVGQLWAGLKGNGCLSINSLPEPLRVRCRVRDEYVRCAVKGGMLVEDDGRRVSVVFTFDPVLGTSGASPMASAQELGGLSTAGPSSVGGAASAPAPSASTVGELSEVLSNEEMSLSEFEILLGLPGDGSDPLAQLAGAWAGP
jgi:hypothetical protein